MVGNIFKTCTHTHSIYGAMHRWELAGNAERKRHWSAATASTSPWNTQPCAQAIIVNDKVTTEVIVVLN